MPGLAHGGAARAVGGDGADVALLVSFGHIAEAGDAAAGGRAADGGKAEVLDRAGDQFAVEGVRDEDGDVERAEAMGAGEQRAVPETEHGGPGDDITARCAGGEDVFVAKRGAEKTDEERGCGRNDR